MGENWKRRLVSSDRWGRSAVSKGDIAVPQAPLARMFARPRWQAERSTGKISANFGTAKPK